MCTKQLFRAVFPMHTGRQKLDDLLDFFDVRRNSLCVYGYLLCPTRPRLLVGNGLLHATHKSAFEPAICVALVTSVWLLALS